MRGVRQEVRHLAGVEPALSLAPVRQETLAAHVE
jgi:hypothetical protein